MKSYGKYHVNPPKKRRKPRRKRNAARRAKKLRNPIPYGITLVNPARKKSRRKRRTARRRNPRPLSSVQPAKQTNMSKTRRRGRRRRNPSRRRSNRRRSTIIAIRNPSRGRRRGRSRRMRNPVGVVSDIFSSHNLTLGAGIVTSQVGTNMVLNQLRASQMAINGSLPGLKPGQESAMAIMLYKLVLGAGVGFLLRNQAPRFSEGMIIGSVAGAMGDLLAQSRVLASLPGGAGVGRYFPAARRSIGGYTPGVPAIFTGPAGQFLNNGAPQPRRRGMGAIVNRGFAGKAAMAAPNPFSS